MTYQQRLRRAAVVRSVAVRLIRRETVVDWFGYGPFGNGSGDRGELVDHTEDETAQEFEWRALQGPILSGQATFRIPDDAKHSVRAESDSLKWLIVVQVDLAKGPRFKGEYVITVLPERVP